MLFELTSLFICLPYVLVYGHPRYNEELEFNSSPNGFFISGTFERPSGHSNREFWICLDYESAVDDKFAAWTQQFKRHLSFRGLPYQQSTLRSKRAFDEKFETLATNEYPIRKCGGLQNARLRPFWFAIRGVWESSTVLALQFINTVEMVESKIVWNSTSTFDAYPWTLLIQHQSSNVDSVEFLGLGLVTVPAPVAADSPIHLRAHGDGIQLNSLSTQLNTIVPGSSANEWYEQLP